MTADRWQRTEALFHAARARPVAERAAFLAEACADDEALRRDVVSLLDDSSSADGFLTQPAVRLAPHLLSDDAPATMIGRTLGVYRLEALLGAGAMGEVYRARDTRLEREVAIKILPAAFTGNPDRLARFEREARMLAAVNHPNICAIYGVEEASGIRFLILELVDGEALSSRIAKHSRLPLGDALALSRQIAEALEVAHERGIIHRDLKPANISITPDGRAKVLDFGLAKTIERDGSSPDLSNAPQDGAMNEGGALIGTAAYMSPEQARGLAVDKRTDIWAFGCVLYEMLSGRAAFGSDTVSGSIAKVLEREPDWSALPAATPPQIRRLLQRCLTKDAKQRLRDIGDARLEIDELDRPRSSDEPHVAKRWSPGPTWLFVAVGLVAIAAGLSVLNMRRTTLTEDPFANAQFSLLTPEWGGMEALADISPDGRFVVFLSDRAGQLDLWWTQVGTGEFKNLTEDIPSLDQPGVLRTFGFSGDGADIWFGGIGRPNMSIPQTGGPPRPFLADRAKALAWSPDLSRIAYFTLGNGDPLSIADRTGADARPLEITPSNVRDWSGVANSRTHNHNPVWSPDNRSIYFVHGVVREWSPSSDEMDIWRIPAQGGAPERLTHLDAAVTFVASLDARTLLYIAPARDGSGSWLWSFDIQNRTARRVVSGLEQFTSVSVSRDGTRAVATRANPTASLWTVPILDRVSGDDDARPYFVDAKRAVSPRFGGGILFYLSARGTADGVWRVTDGQAFEVQKGAEGILLQAPAPSPDGRRVAVVRKQGNKHLLTIMSSNGTDARTLAPSLDAHGTPDWSPDGKWIASGGIDADGHQGLFKIAIDDDRAGELVKLADGEAMNPVWSPDGQIIVYAGPFANGQASLFAVRPDRSPVGFPSLRVSPGGYRFLRDGSGLVYLPRPESLDFWLFDVKGQQHRQLARLSQQGTIRRFDITPDGTHIVFDRVRQNSDIVLIERPRK